VEICPNLARFWNEDRLSLDYEGLRNLTHSIYLEEGRPAPVFDDDFEYIGSPKQRTSTTSTTPIVPSTKKTLLALREEGKEPTSDPPTLTKIIDNFWGSLWGTGNPSRRSMERLLAKYTRKVQEKVKPPTQQDVLLEIETCGDSSPGPDGIPFSAIRLFKDIFAHALYQTLQLLCEGYKPPAGFNEGNLLLIPKKDTGLVSDTRPITISNSVNRILARVVAVRVGRVVDKLLPSSQQGFVYGRHMTNHVLSLNYDFYTSIAKREDLYVLFLDTRKAFDSIYHDFLYKVLESQGWPTWFLHVVRGLLSRVHVRPVLTSSTGQKIEIKRGVKQGCPLSPTLFVLVYDVLIFLLEQKTGIVARAAADDLALSSWSLRSLIQCFPTIDEFAEASGLGLNRDKTGVISTHRPTYGDTQGLKESAWPKARFVESYKYLGVLIGRSLTTRDVFRATMTKARQRASQYSSILLHMTLRSRARVFNTYLTPLFSYLQQFFLVPDSILTEYKELIRKHVIPAAGSAFKYHHLTLGAGQAFPSVSTPVRDLRAANIQSLVQASPLAFSRSHLPQSSMLVHEHRWFAVDLYCHRVCKLFPPRESNAVVYARLINFLYAKARTQDLLFKMERGSILSSDPEGTLLNLEAHGHTLASLKPAVRDYQLKCMLNSVFTFTRGRWFKSGLPIPKGRWRLPCRLCESGEDDIRHWYRDCETVKAAMVLAFRHHQMTTPPELSDDYFFFLPFPPTKGGRRASLILTVCWATWMVACRIARTKERATAALIFRQASLAFSPEREKPSRFGSAGSRSEDQIREGSRYFQKVVSLIPVRSVLVFTDGSSLGNPGPAGAGATLRTSDTGWVDLWSPLGDGTNNEGEVWAIGMALNFISRQKWAPDVQFHLFSDSEYALRGVVEGFRTRPSQPIHFWIQSIKAHLRRSKRHIRLHWVPAHLEVEGNERADHLAKLGAKESRAGKERPTLIFTFTAAGKSAISQK
jgi:ribonuclease HI